MSCSPSQVWRPASASSSLVEEVLFAFAGVEGLNLVVVGVFWFVERHGVHDLPEHVHVFFNVGVDESDDLLARTAGLNSQPPRGAHVRPASWEVVFLLWHGTHDPVCSVIFGDINDGIDGVFALAAWWPVLGLRAAMGGLRPGCSVVLIVG